MKLRRTPIVLAALATLALTSFSSISLADSSCPAGVSWGCEMGGYYASWDYYRGKEFKSTSTAINSDLTYYVDSFWKPYTIHQAPESTNENENLLRAAFGKPLTNGTSNYHGDKLPFTDGQIINGDLVADHAFPNNTGGFNGFYKGTQDLKIDKANSFLSIGGWSYSNAFHTLFLEAVQDQKFKQDLSQSTDIWTLAQDLIASTPIKTFIQSAESTQLADMPTQQSKNFYAPLKNGGAADPQSGIDFDFENPGFMHSHSLMGIKSSDKTDPEGTGKWTDSDFTEVDDTTLSNPNNIIQNYMAPTHQGHIEGLMEQEFYIALIKKVADDVKSQGRKVSIALPIDFSAEPGVCAMDSYPKYSPTEDKNPAIFNAIKHDENSMWCDMKYLQGPSGQSLWQTLFSAIKETNGNINIMDFDMHAQFDQGDGTTTAPALLHTDTSVTADMLAFLQNATDSASTADDMKLIKLGLAPYGHEEIIKEAATTANQGYGSPLVHIETNELGTSKLSKDALNKTIDWGSTPPAGTGDPAPYLDPPNYEAYPNLGGFVDRTGVYPILCLDTTAPCETSTGKDSDMKTSTVNPMASGQPFPTDFNTNEYDIVRTVKNHQITDTAMQQSSSTPPGASEILGSWAWSKELPKDITGFMNGFSSLATSKPVTSSGDVVFTYDSQAAIKSKINYLVKQFGLGGVWFWDVQEDARDSDKSIVSAAKSALDDKTPFPKTGLAIKITDEKQLSKGVEEIDWTATTTDKSIPDFINPDQPVKSTPSGVTNDMVTVKTAGGSTQGSFVTTVDTHKANATGHYGIELEASTSSANALVTTSKIANFDTSAPTPPKPTPGDWTATANPSSATASSTINAGGLKIALTPPQQAAASTVGTAASGDLAIQYITTSSFGASPDAKFTCVADASDASSETCTNDSAITMPDSAKSISLSFTTQSTDSSTSSPYKIDGAQFTINPAANPSKQAFRIMDGTTEVASSSDAVNTGFDHSSTQVVTGKIHLNDTLIIDSEGSKSQTCFVSNDGITPLRNGQSIQITPNTQVVNVTTCKS